MATSDILRPNFFFPSTSLVRCRAHARSLTPNTRSHSPPALLVNTDIFCFAPADLHSSFLSEAKFYPLSTLATERNVIGKRRRVLIFNVPRNTTCRMATKLLSCWPYVCPAHPSHTSLPLPTSHTVLEIPNL